MKEQPRTLKLTKELKKPLLKALKEGIIDYNTLAEVGGFRKRRYYDNFNIELLSNKARQEVENATTDPMGKQPLTRELKVILLNILSSGVVDVKDLGQYAEMERPLFRNLDYKKLSPETINELNKCRTTK